MHRTSGANDLPEDIFRIELNSVFFQQGDELGFKVHFFVMGLLVLYVSNDCGNDRLLTLKAP